MGGWSVGSIGGELGVELGCLTFIRRLGSADRFVEGMRG
jgi:hypothetical protein